VFENYLKYLCPFTNVLPAIVGKTGKVKLFPNLVVVAAQLLRYQ